MIEITRRQAAETVAAFLVLLWRFTSRLGDVWHDWLAIGALYWIFSIYATGRKAWMPVTLALGVVLSALYLVGWRIR